MTTAERGSLTIDGWRFERDPRVRGMWLAYMPGGTVAGKGGFRHMVYRAIGRLPTAKELEDAGV